MSSFYGLTKETRYEQYYQSIYGGPSFKTHALNSTMGMSVDEDGINLRCIRSPVGGGSVFSLTCTFPIGALKALYEYLSNEEEERQEFMIFLLDFQKKQGIATYNLDMIKDTQSRRGD